MALCISGDQFIVQNFGNEGKTMMTNGMCGPPAQGNCSYVGTPSWPAALASSPDIVTIMLGTNDAKAFNWFGVQKAGDSYEQDYINMIRTVQALPSRPQVFVMTLVPLFEPYPYEMDPNVINSIISPLPTGVIGRVAAATGVRVVDIHSVFVAAGFDKSITCDGCHPVDGAFLACACLALSAYVMNCSARPGLAVFSCFHSSM